MAQRSSRLRDWWNKSGVKHAGGRQSEEHNQQQGGVMLLYMKVTLFLPYTTAVVQQ